MKTQSEIEEIKHELLKKSIMDELSDLAKKSAMARADKAEKMGVSVTDFNKLPPDVFL
jgi:hypothetical protein